MDNTPALSIPPEHRGPLLKLARLDEAAITEIRGLLETAPPKLRTYTFAKTVAARAKSIPASDVEAIVVALLEMALVRATAEVSLKTFVDDVVEALTFSAIETLSDSENAKLDQRLTQLLAVRSLALPAKGRSLLIDHANYMCSARVFTDIRPVFGDDVNQSPSTALIVHTLKVSYHRGNEDMRSFFVAMDSSDLDELSELVERARSKERSLQAVLASAGLEPLE